MLLKFQQTIAKPISFEGICLHSGKVSTLKLLPGNQDQGIIFKRTDFKENNFIEACYKNVSSAKLCTTIENDIGVKVSTVEHLLAALYIVGIDNLLIEINSDEVPILDGSSKEFVKILKNAGIKKQNKKRKYLKILEKIKFTDHERSFTIEPNSSLEIDFELNYKNNLIGNQRNEVNFSKDNLDDIINSRTFCLFQDIEKIKKNGLAQGGSLKNAIVVSDEKILNEEGLRNTNEFVNHKILDCAGDLILSGYNILGKVTCYKGGHELTNLFLRNLIDNNKHSFEIIELQDKEIERFSQKLYQSRFAVTA